MNAAAPAAGEFASVFGSPIPLPSLRHESARGSVPSHDDWMMENASPTVYSSVAPHRVDVILPDEVDDDGDGACAAAPLRAASVLTGADLRSPSAWSSPRRVGRDAIDALEVFETLRHLNDPEHPLTLEALNVASLDLISVDDAQSTIDVHFTPTIPHCSMATLIGLCIRVKLIRAMPPRFKVTVRISPGTHSQEQSVNKQLNDKERVAAALENGSLLDVVNKCVARTDKIEAVI